jgi:hypothetical protein
MREETARDNRHHNVSRQNRNRATEYVMSLSSYESDCERRETVKKIRLHGIVTYKAAIASVKHKNV